MIARRTILATMFAVSLTAAGAGALIRPCSALPPSPAPVLRSAASEAPDAPARPSGYARFRKPACEWCGCTNDLEAHHAIPQDTLRALGLVELVNDGRVIVTLCDCPVHHCHLLYGHLGNYKIDNPQLPDMLKIKRLQTTDHRPQPKGSRDER